MTDIEEKDFERSNALSIFEFDVFPRVLVKAVVGQRFAVSRLKVKSNWQA
jgi:hypothetical protein